MLHERYVRHLQDPSGGGRLEGATHRGLHVDAACGDELELDLDVREGRVAAARFRVRGCSGAIAAASALATLLPGREASPEAVGRADLEAELGEVPPAKRHALRLALGALRAALASPVA